MRALSSVSMINYSAKDGMLMFQVRVVPRASRSEIVGEHDGALRIRIAASPVEGAANEELIRLLARKLGVSRRAITITGGHSSRLKHLCITDAPQDALAVLLGKQI